MIYCEELIITIAIINDQKTVVLEVASRPDDVVSLMSPVADRGLCSSNGRSKDGESATTAAGAAGETNEATTDEEEAD